MDMYALFGHRSQLPRRLNIKLPDDNVVSILSDTGLSYAERRSRIREYMNLVNAYRELFVGDRWSCD